MRGRGRELFVLMFAFWVAVADSYAQTPLGFNYQGVARSADGSPLINQFIGLRVSITSGPSGSIDYVEEHHPETNEFGLFNVVVGQGQSSGNISDVNWGEGNKWLQIEIDPQDNSNYALVGSQQMMSVPYSLYSAKSGEALNAGIGIDISNGQINNIMPDKNVAITGNGAATVTGTYPNFEVDVANVDDGDADASNEIQTLSEVLTVGADAGAVAITNLADPSGLQDAATKNYVDDQNALDLDKSLSNELNTGASYQPNNTLRITDAGGNKDVWLGQLNSHLDANFYNIRNLEDPSNPGDAVNLGYLEAKDATDYAFKSNVNEIGSGVALTFDLSIFDFDEGLLISGNQLLIKETGVYMFNVKGTSSSNAPLVINVNDINDNQIGLINVGRYFDSILLKLNAGDVIELRANTTTNGEIFTLEFFGYKI